MALLLVRASGAILLLVRAAGAVLFLVRVHPIQCTKRVVVHLYI